jgi:CRISPR system Cascade subunit CasD
MRALIVHLDAPMMAFGGVLVDGNGPTEAAPGASLLTGLLGNALGWTHSEVDALQRLQDRLIFAARLDRPGALMVDFHTVDLGQAHLVGTGWTTRGAVEGREGGSASEATHIRRRQYWCDRVMTVALTLAPADEAPNLDALAAALRRPARPLFIGRKPCIPSRPLFAGFVEAEDVMDAALRAPWPSGVTRPRGPVELWGPTDEATADGHTLIGRDLRTWAIQQHAGRRLIRHEQRALPEVPHA